MKTKHYVHMGITALICLAQMNGAYAQIIFESKQTITNSFGMDAEDWAKENRFLHVGDFNGDGEDDLFIQGEKCTNNSYLILGNSSNVFNTRILISNSYGMSRSEWAYDSCDNDYPEGHVAHIGDFTGDGKDDILLQARYQTDHTFLLKGSTSGLSNRVTISTSYGMPKNDWGFFDDCYPVSSSTINCTESGRVVHVGDFTGDGNDDIILQGRRNTNNSYLLKGSTSGLSSRITISNSYGMPKDDWGDEDRKLHVGDFTGDGKDDIILQGNGTNNNSFLLKGSTSGLSTRVRITNLYGMNMGDWAESHRYLHVGDFTGDGKQDVLLQGRGSNNNSYLLKGSSSGLSTRTTITNLYGMSKSQWAHSERELSVGEFTGDGRDDVLLRGQGTSNNSYILRGSGSGLSSRIQISNLYGMSKSQWADSERESHIGDFDGDGRDDIVLQGKKNSNNTLLMKSKNMYGNISGPTSIAHGTSATYTHTKYYGTSPFTYKWERQTGGSYSQVGTGPSYSQVVTLDLTLRLTVTDANQNSFTDFHTTLVQSGGECDDFVICPAPFKQITSESLPEQFELNQNYPNPFNPTTQISYSLAVDSNVQIRIYNVLGQQVDVLVNQFQSQGRYSASFDASSLNSGVYLARIEALGASGELFTKTIKMQLIK